MDIVSTVSSFFEEVFSLSLFVTEFLFSNVIQLFNLTLYLVASLATSVYSVLQFVTGKFFTIFHVFLKLSLFGLRWLTSLLELVYRGLVCFFSLLLQVAGKFGIDIDSSAKQQGVNKAKITGENIFVNALLLWKNLMGYFLYFSIIVALIIFVCVLIKLSISKYSKQKIELQQPQTRATRNANRTSYSINQRPPINTSILRTVRRRPTAVKNDKKSSDMEQKDEVSRLNEKLIEEKYRHSCVVCLGNEREILLKPCKHFCLCVSCLSQLKRCPVCNQTISTSEKIFHV